MATSVGAVSCDLIRGDLPPMGPMIETWHTPGVDGDGAQDHGDGGGRFEIQAIKYGTKAAVDAWKAAILALRGTVVAIENSDGDSQARELIETVRFALGPWIIPGTSTTHRGVMTITGRNVV